MTITATFEVPGMTAEQYDEVMAQLEARGCGSPEGRAFHVAAPTADGWTVVDVWESPGQLEAFAETLMPVLAAAGVTPPEPRIAPVHNLVGSA